MLSEYLLKSTDLCVLGELEKRSSLECKEVDRRPNTHFPNPWLLQC